MISVSAAAGHIILTPTQPVGSQRPQRGSNPGPPDQESGYLLCGIGKFSECSEVKFAGSGRKKQQQQTLLTLPVKQMILFIKWSSLLLLPSSFGL